jgi:succinyl-diaminopimelate desuccinylase
VNVATESTMETMHASAANYPPDVSECEALGIAGADAASGALTVNLGTMALDQREAEAVLNIRYPVTWSWQEIHAKIAAALKAPGISTEVAEHLPPLYLPKDHFLIQHLLRVYEEQTGQKAEPLAIGGGTYARAVPNAAAFGAQFPGRPDLAHQRDEYIEIEDLMLHAKLYAHAIAALCTEDARE